MSNNMLQSGRTSSTTLQDINQLYFLYYLLGVSNAAKLRTRLCNLQFYHDYTRFAQGLHIIIIIIPIIQNWSKALHLNSSCAPSGRSPPWNMVEALVKFEILLGYFRLLFPCTCCIFTRSDFVLYCIINTGQAAQLIRPFSVYLSSLTSSILPLFSEPFK